MPCSPGDEDQVLWPGRGFCEKPPPCFPALTPCLGKVYQTSLSAPLGTSAGPGLPLEHLCSPNFDFPIGSPALHSAPHRVFSKVLCRSVTQHIRGNSEESRDYFCCCWNQDRHSGSHAILCPTGAVALEEPAKPEWQLDKEEAEEELQPKPPSPPTLLSPACGSTWRAPLEAGGTGPGDASKVARSRAPSRAECGSGMHRVQTIISTRHPCRSHSSMNPQGIIYLDHLCDL